MVRVVDIYPDGVVGGIIIALDGGSWIRVQDLVDYEGELIYSGEDSEGYEWYPSEEELAEIFSEAIAFAERHDPAEPFEPAALGWKWENVRDLLLILQEFLQYPQEVREKAAEFAKNVVQKAKEIARELQPGEYRSLGWEDEDFVLEFLPPDWEKYSRYGCDVDGGNYCSYWVPVVYRNRKGEVQYYIATWSSCELGEPVMVVELNGKLEVVREDYAGERAVVYRPWHPDYNVSSPLTEEELFWAALLAAADWVAERAEYEKGDY